MASNSCLNFLIDFKIVFFCRNREKSSWYYVFDELLR